MLNKPSAKEISQEKQINGHKRMQEITTGPYKTGHEPTPKGS